jgi:hypothetical protein
MASTRSARMTATAARAALASACAAALTAAGCASGQKAEPAPRARSTRTQPSPSPTGSLRSLAAAYLAIAEPANHKLDIEVDAYADNAHSNLAAAEKALRAEAATERHFDLQLAAISLPPTIEVTAQALIRVNEIRARLTLKQAAARSIPALLSFTTTHSAADAELEAQVRFIRQELGLPPPQTS